jgi:hypothetical protein
VIAVEPAAPPLVLLPRRPHKRRPPIRLTSAAKADTVPAGIVEAIGLRSENLQHDATWCCYLGPVE